MCAWEGLVVPWRMVDTSRKFQWWPMVLQFQRVVTQTNGSLYTATTSIRAALPNSPRLPPSHAPLGWRVAPLPAHRFYHWAAQSAIVRPRGGSSMALINNTVQNIANIKIKKT